MNKILIIETDPLLLELLAELLDLYGLSPLTTTSYEQGYELTKLEKPDLILCGHSSKNNQFETCWQLLQKIRQDLETANIPFIFMAGSDLTTIPNWQNYLRYEEILQKPFSSQVLIEKIHTNMQSSLNTTEFSVTV
ncbi:MAG: response regulator [Nostocales cyanobacterium]|nr:MAG: response regulator [Nostocales cyanobacterium]